MTLRGQQWQHEMEVTTGQESDGDRSEAKPRRFLFCAVLTIIVVIACAVVQSVAKSKSIYH